MRERLLAALVALTLLTVVLYGVPRAFLRADAVDDDARAEVTRSAQALAEVVAVRLEADLPPQDAPLAFLTTGDSAVLRTDGESLVLAGTPVPGGVVATAAVPGGTVEVRRPQAAVRRAVVDDVRPIVLTGLLALLVAAGAAVLLADRLARPFRLLADRAATLDRPGDDDLPPLRMREAEAIAEGLRASARRLEEVVRREREFAGNASHQLRTPLTGVRLRVEDLAQWPETAPVVREELGHVLTEVDRLAATVASLLAMARAQELEASPLVAPAELLAAAAARWRGLAERSGRTVSVQVTTSEQAARLPRVAVDQVLDVLVHNALEHGTGRVELGARVQTGSLVLHVQDEGRTEQPVGPVVRRRRAADRDRDARSAGEGIGLSLSVDVAEAVGGRLLLAAREPTRFELHLPV